MKKHIPNTLSVSRVIISAITLYYYNPASCGSYWIFIMLVALAAITDVADGRLARKWMVTSRLGYILDGIGDRAFYIAMIMMFYQYHDVNSMICWALIFREVLIYAVRLIDNNIHAKPWSRSLSVGHAYGIRVWILSYIAIDLFKCYSFVLDTPDYYYYYLFQNSLAILTISVSYFGIFTHIQSILLCRSSDNSK